VETLKVGMMRFKTAKLSQIVVGDTLRNANLGSDSIQPGSLQQDAAWGHSLLIQKWIAGACLSLGLVSGMLHLKFRLFQEVNEIYHMKLRIKNVEILFKLIFQVCQSV
jgi:hypothetical protein